MPFWMWALGRFFIDTSRVSIPYTSLVRTLLTLILPLLVGVLIRRFTVKGANFLIKITKPMNLLFILFIITYGTWVNWYMYEIMGTVPQVIPAAILLPWFGFLLGFLIAKFLARLKKMQAITVGIETGYQNPSIPIVMLQGNFVQPEGDLGAVMPVATAFFTPVPLYFYYLYIEIRRKCFKGEVDVEADSNSEEDSTNDKKEEDLNNEKKESKIEDNNNSIVKDEIKENGQLHSKENPAYVETESEDNKGVNSLTTEL